MGKRFSEEELTLLIESGEYNDDELEEIIVTADPSLWAEKYLYHPDHPNQPLRLREYQRKMINSNSRSKIARCGRRIGKTVTLCAEALWHALTEKDYRVVIITPMKENLNEIERVLTNMALDSPFIKKSIVNKEKDPLYIKFNNNSEIVCLAANKYPEQVRGKGCNSLYIDEADYLNDAALDAVTALLMTKAECNVCHREHGAYGCMHNAGEVYTLDSGKRVECDPMRTSTLWCSSTPTGARRWFYDQCKIAMDVMKKRGDDNPEYAHFHFSSKVNPNWGPTMEADMRKLISDDIRWMHEVEAEFGESAHSTYKGSLIDDAVNRGRVGDKYYKYTDYSPEVDHGTYIFGIDWNGQKHGVQIVIIQLTFNTVGDQTKVELRVVNRVGIHKAEYLIEKSVEVILELNERYQPRVIAVDSGYGEGQIGQLKKYAKQHPELGLEEKLLVVKFGEQLEIPDPFGGKPKKVPAKNYMIDNVRWLLESDCLVLPKHEEEGKDSLVYQLRNFRVEKYTDAGRPVFEKIVDHAHDAFILACYGFRERLSTADRLQYTPPERQVLPYANPMVIKNPLRPFNQDFGRNVLSDYVDEDEQPQSIYVPTMNEHGVVQSKGGIKRRSLSGGFYRTRYTPGSRRIL